jgi:hypothetical protein
LQTVVWLFYGGFGAVASTFLAERPFRLCWYRTRFTVDIDTFVPVSSSIFTTFCTKVRSSLVDRACLFPKRYEGCVVPWCLYLRTIVCTDECGTFRYLETEGTRNQTCGGLQFFIWGLGWFILIFPWCQAKRHWVWR